MLPCWHEVLQIIVQFVIKSGHLGYLGPCGASCTCGQCSAAVDSVLLFTASLIRFRDLNKLLVVILVVVGRSLFLSVMLELARGNVN